ncbi:hypothetical protein AVEN_32690-1 [Araneus ventricosus]|uniref:Uncharacterized protein n=1 Tax=Araneus ventricosus TaxID=182803 RepID=A0A4Y2UEG8_ARAVE|nr:hypothetical protein AVEN_32690-1 [Araneus ventricosus]
MGKKNTFRFGIPMMWREQQCHTADCYFGSVDGISKTYNDLSKILETIHYQEHRWMVFGDIKMLTMLLGQQAGYTNIRSPYTCGTVETDTSIRPKLTGHFEVP